MHRCTYECIRIGANGTVHSASGSGCNSAPPERANRVYCFEFRAPRLPINAREFRGSLANEKVHRYATRGEDEFL